jgi:flagellar basal body P-ring formation protein FlgA
MAIRQRAVRPFFDTDGKGLPLCLSGRCAAGQMACESAGPCRWPGHPMGWGSFSRQADVLFLAWCRVGWSCFCLKRQNTVRLSKPQHRFMKHALPLLCWLLDRVVVRGLWLGLALYGVGLASWAATGAQAAPAKRSPQDALTASVKDWVAQTRKVPADQVTMAPLDARVKVRPCDQALAMDLPFSSAETVRVRCPQPVWQQYVRVSVSGPAPETVAKAPREQATEPAKRWVLVASVPLQRGMTLSETHVQRAQVDTSGMPVNVLEHVSEVMHAEVVRDVRPGTPLRSQDIRPTVLVKRGQMVLLSVGQAQGFQISARVEAMQDGRFGEQIKLKNRDSGRELSGRVQGPNQVVGL